MPKATTQDNVHIAYSSGNSDTSHSRGTSVVPVVATREDGDVHIEHSSSIANVSSSNNENNNRTMSKEEELDMFANTFETTRDILRSEFDEKMEYWLNKQSEKSDAKIEVLMQSNESFRQSNELLR